MNKNINNTRGSFIVDYKLMIILLLVLVTIYFGLIAEGLRFILSGEVELINFIFLLKNVSFFNGNIFLFMFIVIIVLVLYKIKFLKNKKLYLKKKYKKNIILKRFYTNSNINYNLEIKKGFIIEERTIATGFKEDVEGGIILKLYLPLVIKDKEIFFEDSMKKIIRKGKDKYNMKEYAACLEKSQEGLFYVRIYINQFMPLKEINKQGSDLIGVEDLTKGYLDMTIVKSEEYKTKILSYILKAPLRKGICKKYSLKTLNIDNKVEDIISEDNFIIEERTIATGFKEDSINEKQKSVKLNKKMAKKLSLKNDVLKE